MVFWGSMIDDVQGDVWGNKLVLRLYKHTSTYRVVRVEKIKEVKQ